MWKYCTAVQDIYDNLIRRIRFAYRIIKATDTHLEYIIFSLEYSILLRIIIPNTRKRKCQCIATIYIYKDKFHMATCFDS
jgi:hypothetical protein